MWIAANELPPTGGHPFYQRLNQVLDGHALDEFIEAQCAPFYATPRWMVVWWQSRRSVVCIVSAALDSRGPTLTHRDLLRRRKQTN
jgi:hypothetical protein